MACRKLVSSIWGCFKQLMPKRFPDPLKRHQVSDFPNAYEPLSSAKRHPSVIKTYERQISARSSPSSTEEQIILDGGSPSMGRDSERGQIDLIQHNAHTLEGLRAEVELEIAASGHDSMYERKARVLSLAIQDLGCERYQRQLFLLCGFGWLSDNLWLQGIALMLPALSLEFGLSDSFVRYATFALFAGLGVGSMYWGIVSDIVGRRLAFNLCLMLAGIFGVSLSIGTSYTAIFYLVGALGFGFSGSLPIDGALFLEFLPRTNGRLMTLLSIWWPMGQLVSSLAAWGFIVNASCDPNGKLPTCLTSKPGQPCCGRANNMGWRYMAVMLGLLTFAFFLCRYFFFHQIESPKFLLSRGRQAEAVASVHGIAYKNKRKTWLTEEILNEIGGVADEAATPKRSWNEVAKQELSKYSKDRVAPLFANEKLARSTELIWFSWAAIGLGYTLFNAFLPQYLKYAGPNHAPTPMNIQYRNYAITSICGIPGSLLACYTVDVKWLGRKGTLIASTFVTAVLLFCFTLSTDPTVQVVLSSLEAFFQNIMYGVLYAYTPEVFPAANRGTGTGIASFFNRIAGLAAPVVAIHAPMSSPNTPIYASAALMLTAFVALCFLPIETRGRQSV